jgi:hypothetical protein
MLCSFLENTQSNNQPNIGGRRFRDLQKNDGLKKQTAQLAGASLNGI